MVTIEEKSQALAEAAGFTEFVRRQPDILKFVFRAMNCWGLQICNSGHVNESNKFAKLTCEVDELTAVASWKDFAERTAQAEPVEGYTTSEVAKMSSVFRFNYRQRHRCPWISDLVVPDKISGKGPATIVVLAGNVKTVGLARRFPADQESLKTMPRSAKTLCTEF